MDLLFYIWLIVAFGAVFHFFNIFTIQPYMRKRKLKVGTTWAYENALKRDKSPWDDKGVTIFEVTEIMGQWVRYREVSGTFQWSDKISNFCLSHIPYEVKGDTNE